METKGQHSLDDLFRRGFENEESTPPSAAWAQMESLLDAQQSGGEDKKNRRVVAWYWAAAAVVLPFLLAGFWWLKSGNGESQLAQSSIPSVVEQPKVETTAAASSNEKTASPAQKTGAVVRNDGFENEKPVTANRKVATASTPKAGTQSIAGKTREFAPSEKGQVADNRKVNAPVSQPNAPVVSSQEVAVEKVDPPKSMVENEVAQTSAQPKEEDGNEIASIEYRSSAKAIEGTEIAEVEWKKESRPKRSIAEQIARIKAGDIGKLPTLADARENLADFLGIK
ncbi:MAG TPA: hypothetical protein PLK63_05310 [Catalimonadaceae bacterium]|nr:hypothetical protein [Catalimonadaceae bacterium]